MPNRISAQELILGSGLLTATGNNLYLNGIQISGDTSNLATSANLALTGQTLSNWTGASTGLYYPLTGNPSGFLTNATLGAVTALNVTGLLVSGQVILTGSGNISLFLNNQTITISGATGTLATAANLASTGSIISDWTGSTPSLYYPKNNNISGYVTGASNIGAGSGIYSGTTSNDFKLKTLIGGSGMQISGNSSNNSLTLIVTGIAGGGQGTPYDPYTARYYV